jgi:NADPH:quinone reductase-like Zn-dependent oxidoreductase
MDRGGSSMESRIWMRSSVRMTKAVRFDEYGGIDVLKVVDVEKPAPGEGEVLVRVRAAGINPGEAAVREGRFHDLWPATFPSGQGSDLAGVVEAVGPGVDGVAAGDEVIGFTDERASQAEYAVVEAANVTPKPPEVPWEVAGALHVVGATAWAAVRAVSLRAGDVVAISGAAGGVGTLAVQLARHAGATVLGLAGEAHHAWLRDHGAIPVAYGDGVADRIREHFPDGVDGLADGSVQDALVLPAVRDGGKVATVRGYRGDGSDRVEVLPTLVRRYAENGAALDRLREQVESGALTLRVARTFAPEEAPEAHRVLAAGGVRGRLVITF